jgi:UDP-N-acetyl-D-mannosaminuronate dehydrogenase
MGSKVARIVFGLGLVVGLPAAAQEAADDDEIYGVDSWPAGLKNVPCEAFKQNPDKSWSQAAVIVVQPGNLRMTGHTFKDGTGEAKMLDRRCARKNTSKRPGK